MSSTSRLTNFSPANIALARRFRHHATHDEYWQGKRHKILISLVAPFIILQCLFLALQSYIFGSSYQSPQRVHQLHVLAVDFDGGVVGQSLRAAWEQLQSPQMLGLKWHTASEYPDPEAVFDAVYKGHYWAGIYASDGASTRLADAIGANSTAQQYGPSQALAIIYNEARYPDFEGLYVMSNLEELVLATRLAYNELNGTKAIVQVPPRDTASLMVVLNPIDATIQNIKPLNNGSTVLYNTVDIVFTILLQFFFLMAFNSLLSDWQLDARLPVKHHVILRILIGVTYTFIGSMLTVSNLYAYRGSTQWTAAHFVLLWMAYRLEMHVIFLVLETALTFFKMPWLPIFVVTFIIINVTSAIFPFDLSAGFYRWGWALPAHEVYQLEITILSGGANNTLDIALPVLFAWWIVCIPLAFFSLVWRCSKAALADEEVAEIIKRDQERRGTEETDESRRKRHELLEQAARDEQQAAAGTFGTGFRAPGPFRSTRREEDE